MKKKNILIIALFVLFIVFLFSWRFASILPSLAGVSFIDSLSLIMSVIGKVFTTLPYFTTTWEILRIAFIITFVISLIVLFAFFPKLENKWNWDAYYDIKRKMDLLNPLSMNVDDDKFAASDINEMVGLQNVKGEIDKILAFYKVQSARKKEGLATGDLNLNFVFYGNPGTGKTVVARYIAKKLKESGILKKGQLFEADRSTMVDYGSNGTESKVHEVVNAARGGVLFIDEAYSLTVTRDDYGMEAINTLLKLMEDYRNELVVIVAGYDDLMRDFIQSNPGLQSRFTKHIYFRDYNAEELTQIFEIYAKKMQYSLGAEARQELKDYFLYKVDTKDNNFANGRLARNVFEETIGKQALRVGGSDKVSKQGLMEIRGEDLPLT